MEVTVKHLTDRRVDLNFYERKTGEVRWGFPCNEQGEVDREKMTDVAWANYQKCLVNPELFSEVEVTERNYTERIGKCSCGREVYLYGDTYCECGKLYNGFGQELRDPKYWGRGYDDEY